MTRRLLSPFAASAVWLAVVVARGNAAEPRKPDFGRDIQPLLSQNCFPCHGPDANSRKADLRLDTLAGATANDAITPGKSAESEAIRRIFSDDPAEVMPPPRSNLKLSAPQKELFKRWVDAGAPYTRHWAFVAPVRPAVPPVAGGATIRNSIDAFIVERLQQEGLAPAPEASREKLLRRVTLDLTGLPPTPEEIDAFLAERSDDAYERVVDRLLDSPRFGERMVWEWLDAARYADTNGYQGDPTRAMWYWRDWAIEAFNRNLPFDQFTVEQLAGDLLPEPTREQLVATGFHRNHMINGEGGRIAEESRVEYVQDRVETTATVWMGLTFTCCRCHDHKYDPFTQKEYYQLAAYFNSIAETGANDLGGLANPVISLPSAELQQRIDTLRGQEQTAERERAGLAEKVAAEQPAWERRFVGDDGRLREAQWTPLKPLELSSEQGTTLATLDDGSIRADGAGKNPDVDEYRITAAPAGPITVLRFEALPDDLFPARGPGRADNGNFVLSELVVEVAGKPVALTFVSADFSQQGWDAKGAIDGDPKTGWAVAPEFGKPHTLVVALKTPLDAAGQGIALRLAFRFGSRHTLGRFRIETTNAEPSLVMPLPAGVRAALSKPADQRTDTERGELSKYFADTHPLLAAANQKADAARQAREKAEREAPRTMIMRDDAQPRKTFVLVKGAYNVPADEVEHGVPAGLVPLPADAAKNRLALARWLVSAEHPLTARVTVNRLWQQFFGTGLVKSAEDFGIQGDKPSHPELLDWLAVEFVTPGQGGTGHASDESVRVGTATPPGPPLLRGGTERGAWNVKRLVRLIVTSATYRQSSKVTAALFERDPDNRLLARGPRLRLPSWMLRDQALALGGLLVEKRGGPPVKGYQPPGVWEDATFGQIRYEQDHGEALYRRSLYMFWRRIVAPTLFFDVANRQNCTVKTGRTNTPLHALVTLNDVTFVEAARGLAQRALLEKTPDDTGRIAGMFRRCTARAPRPAEVERLVRRLAALRGSFSRDADAAGKLIAVGESKPDERLPAAELAAWTSLASLLLNLDETITNE